MMAFKIFFIIKNGLHNRRQGLQPLTGFTAHDFHTFRII